MKQKYGVWLGVLALAGLTQVSAAQPSGRAVLRSVQTTVQGDITIVTIEADGPLPQPVSGALDDPPRIFFDFTGVTSKARGTTGIPGNGAVKQARVALYSTAPDVTRVALDLARHETFRVDADARQSGRIRILVGSQSAVMRLAPTPAAPAAPAAPTAPAPTAPKPVPPPPPSTPPVVAASTPAIPSPVPAPPSPARRGVPVAESIPGARLQVSDIESYRRQLSGALERLESRRSVLAAIDLDQDVTGETLASTVADFRDLRRILEAIKPSDVLRPTHDLLIASSVLGAGAASQRIDAADLQMRRNAASAAAGALMLLDRACAALGCQGGR